MVNREIRAAGTKTYTRDRVTPVAEWAWPYIEQRCLALAQDAPLFAAAGVDRWTARDAHHRACLACGYADCTQRDARHSYAVRAIRSGVPAEVVARQLGHANAVLVHKVYGRFAPNQGERDKWERVASAAAAARMLERAVYQPVSQGAKPPTHTARRIEDSPGVDYHSRGGTRTRDPGIMSAVL